MISAMASKGVWRMIGRQVRSRRDRSIALGAGILVASVSFSLLTADVSTSQLEVTTTVAHNYAQSSYDILVRPRGSRTTLENSEGVIRPGAVSGISGGITLAQWQQILRIPGVSVAAPIAVLGYALPQTTFPIDLTSDMGTASHALFRVDVERVTDNGLTHQADAPVYVYITRNAMAPEPTEGNTLAAVAPKEVLGPGNDQPVCAEVLISSSPFDSTDRSDGIAAFWECGLLVVAERPLGQHQLCAVRIRPRRGAGSDLSAVCDRRDRPCAGSEARWTQRRRGVRPLLAIR
jgi:hypothetical protein